ncbi:hypothetical protein AB0D08_30640 [Kitasatospora sp. NPDC048540]|uniref:hypothetical protein n=1 Tax=Kitasatospora sp. NPDC048540 TaxID=3155634 RepID=UPI0033EB0806
MTGRIGRGGRKGQTHTATPRLRSHDVPPASEVTVTRPDGTTDTVPAQKARNASRPAPRRGPLVCAICGHPAKETPTLYSNARRSRGKPVHGACDPTATAKRPKQPPQPRQPAPPPPVRGRITPGADPATAWIELSCTQCGAAPGRLCTMRYSDGSSAESNAPHRERAAAAQRAARPR